LLDAVDRVNHMTMLFDSDYARAAELVIERRGSHAEGAARTQVRELRRSGHFDAADIWDRLATEIEQMQAAKQQVMFDYEPPIVLAETPVDGRKALTA
jgi:hypothetical protein